MILMILRTSFKAHQKRMSYCKTNSRSCRDSMDSKP
jgi:hypothetical protein